MDQPVHSLMHKSYTEPIKFAPIESPPPPPPMEKFHRHGNRKQRMWITVVVMQTVHVEEEPTLRIQPLLNIKLTWLVSILLALISSSIASYIFFMVIEFVENALFGILSQIKTISNVLVDLAPSISLIMPGDMGIFGREFIHRDFCHLMH